MRFVKISSVILVFFLIFTSCQDDPTSLGKDLIEKEVQIKEFNSITNSLQQSSGTYLADSVSLGSSSTILLGNLDYAKSTILVRFGAILADTIRNSIDSSHLSVLSAEVELKPNYKIGDLSQQFNFTAHEITSQWGTMDFNSDSLASLSYDPMELSDSKEITDSLITFNIDSNLALKWLKSMSGDSLLNNYGMMMIPQSTNLIYGFRGVTGAIYDNSPLLRYIVQNENNKIDTIITYSTYDTHVVEGTPPPVDVDKIQLVAGFAQRGKLFFDLSEFPQNVNINKAELTLSVDTVSSVMGSPDADFLILYFFSDSTDNTLNESYRPVSIDFNDNNQFKGTITRFIQTIVSGADNQGFSLILGNEITAVDKYVIYGSKYSDVNLQPKLVIYYNELN